MKNFKGKYYIHRDSVMSIYSSMNYGTTRSMTLLRLFLSHADLQINSTVVSILVLSLNNLIPKKKNL